MATVHTNHARHSTSTDVAERLAMGAAIVAGDAAAIASWYQTPRGHGATFAALASGCSVELDDLIDATEREIDLTPESHAEMSALADWATDSAR